VSLIKAAAQQGLKLSGLAATLPRAVSSGVSLGGAPATISGRQLNADP